MPSQTSEDLIVKQVVEHRDGTEFIYVKKKLADMVVAQQVTVRCRGIDLFQDDEAVRKLSAYDELTEGSNGYVLCKKAWFMSWGIREPKDSRRKAGHRVC